MQEIILTKIEHIQEDIQQIKSDVKEIRKMIIPPGTFWRVSTALFLLAIGSYGAYLM